MKSKKVSLLAISVATIGFGIAYIGTHADSIFKPLHATSTGYGVNLSSKNAYVSGASQTVKSITGGADINFTYYNCDQEEGAHALIGSGGYIVNTTPLSSVTGLVADFEGPLEFRYSYDGSVWSKFCIAKANKEFVFVDEPAYIQLYANQHDVLLNEVRFSYTCRTVTDSFEYLPRSESFGKDDLPKSQAYTMCDYNEFELATKYVYANGSNAGMYFPSTSAALISYTEARIKSVQITLVSGKSFTGTVYSGTEFQSKTHSKTFNSSTTVTFPEGDKYFMIVPSKARTYIGSITVNYEVRAIDPVAIEVYPDDYEITPGTERQMFIDYAPVETNRNMDVTWSISDETVATITETGLVTVNEFAPIGATFEVTAVSNYSNQMVSTATMTVVSEKIDEWTLMIYMCGADLESDGAQASLDILEMLEVNHIPDDVNIFIFTGGAKYWAIGLDPNKNYILTLFNDDNGEADVGIAYSGFSSYMPMGDPNTLFNFMAMCIDSAPAQRYGLILWNHGGAMQGCCFDEVDPSQEGLTNYETSLVFDALMEYEIITEKMDFIGYDCCLMAVQDIVVMNSLYFKYMVGAEESESGTGWNYDCWLDDLYMNKPTNEVLRAICDSFILDNDGTAIDGNEDNDQTLAYFDLEYAGIYYTFFEEFAEAWMTHLGSTSKLTIQQFFKTVKTYGVDQNGSELAFGVFDVMDFLYKLYNNATLCPDKTLLNKVALAFEYLVEYSACGLGAGNSNGMTLFYAISSSAQQTTYYDQYETPFTNWIAFNRKYGY